LLLASEPVESDDVDVYGRETISSEPLSSYNFEVSQPYLIISQLYAAKYAEQ